jgi:hypothetical protein
MDVEGLSTVSALFPPPVTNPFFVFVTTVARVKTEHTFVRNSWVGVYSVYCCGWFSVVLTLFVLTLVLGQGLNTPLLKQLISH